MHICHQTVDLIPAWMGCTQRVW